MWIYEKKLEYPVKIKTPNPKLAQVIISQLGGPDGELAASMRYLHQRYSSPYNVPKSLHTLKWWLQLSISLQEISRRTR